MEKTSPPCRTGIYTYIYIDIHRYMNRQHRFCYNREYSQQAESDSAHVHIPLRAASTWPCNPHASQRAPRASPTRRRREQHFSEVTHKTMGLIVVVQRKIVCGTLACDMFRTAKHSTPQTCQWWEGFGLWQEENWSHIVCYHEIMAMYCCIEKCRMNMI